MSSTTKSWNVNYSYGKNILYLIGFSITCYYWYIAESWTKYVFLGLVISIYLDYSPEQKKLIKNKGKSAIIITDPDEDFDDEIAIYFLIEKIKSKLQGFNHVFISFAPGIYSKGKTGNDRKQVFHKYFPEYQKDIFKINSTTIHLIEGEKLKSMYGYRFDILLQIAPLTNIGYDFFVNNQFGKRIVMGDLKNPNKSINLSKTLDSESMLEEFSNQETALADVPSISITTDLSRKVPFTCSIIDSLPEDFSDLVKKKAFNLLVGRVPAESSYCENITVNANLMTALNYLGANNVEILRKEKDNNDMILIENQCEDFINRMKVVKDRHTMKNALIDIYLTVIHITGCDYHDSNFQVSSLSNSEEALGRFLEYINKNNCSLTPAYDLLAMHLMLNPEMNNAYYDVGWEDELKMQLVKDYS